jgi:hypothetical protein
MVECSLTRALLVLGILILSQRQEQGHHIVVGAAEQDFDAWLGIQHHLAPAFVYTGMADAGGDATLAAGAANSGSVVEAVAGELTRK